MSVQRPDNVHQGAAGGALLTGGLAAVLASTCCLGPSVPAMYCSVCPITVKKALIKVPGVSQVEVSLAKHQATVSFDDARTSVAALTRATKDAGYRSTLAANGK
jgi:mercuric ion binding protein